MLEMERWKRKANKVVDGDIKKYGKMTERHKRRGGKSIQEISRQLRVNMREEEAEKRNNAAGIWSERITVA